MKKSELIVLIFLLLLVIFLRIPSLFEPYWYGDEGITLTVGQEIRNGAILYKDQADNKTPLLYFLAAMSPTLFQLRLLLFFWVIVTTFVFYFLARALITYKAAIISTAIFVLLTSLPVMEGNIANGEIFFILLTISGILFSFWGTKKNTLLPFVISGISFGMGFLFKPPAVIDMGAILFFLLLFSKTSVNQFISRLLFLATGFILPQIPVLIYFYFNQTLADYVEYAFRWNMVYSSWKSNFIIPYGSQLFRVLLLGIFVAIVFFLRQRFASIFSLILLWFGFSTFGSFLSERHYTHYFLQMVPSFVLVLGFLLATHKRILAVILFSLIFLWIFLNPGSLSYQISYYRNFWEYSLGKRNIYAYRNFFDPQVARTYGVADFLLAQKPGEIFVWGDEPLIYALSKRSPVGRFSAAYNIVWEEKRKKETWNFILQKRPVFILVTRPEKFSFPELDKLLVSDYTFTGRIEDVFIYAREN